MAVSPALTGVAAEAGILIAFLSYGGRLPGRVEGPQTADVLLRRAQHEAMRDAGAALPVARSVVAAKIANQRAVLRRQLRGYGGA